MCNILANIVVAIQFFLLDAITGGVVSIINAIRCIVFYIYKKKNMKPSIITLIVFEVIEIISGCFSWQNIWSLIPILLTTFYTYSIWQDNIELIRLATGIVGGGWAIYDVIVKAYVGVIQEIAQLISAIIAIYRSKKKINIGVDG